MSMEQVKAMAKLLGSGISTAQLITLVEKHASEQAKNALAFMKAFKATGSRVPGSNPSFAAFRSRALSLSLIYGSSSFFITLNPSALSSKLGFEMAGVVYTAEDSSGRPVDRPSQFECWKVVASNPAMCADFFLRALDCFYEVFLGWPVSWYMNGL